MNLNRERTLIQDKALKLAVEVTNLTRELRIKYGGDILVEQLFLDGTGVGIKINRVFAGDFKRSPSQNLIAANSKAGKTIYWLRLLFETQYIEESEYRILLVKVEEIIALIKQVHAKFNSRKTP